MNPIIKNLKNKYQNEIDTAKTNIEIFLEKSVGVAEHIDFATTINT